MFTCSPQFTKLVNRPLTKSRESAAPYTPKYPRVPRHLGIYRVSVLDFGPGIVVANLNALAMIMLHSTVQFGLIMRLWVVRQKKIVYKIGSNQEELHMKPGFDIGILSFALPLAFCLLYLAGRQLRTFGAWMDNTDRPKERAKAYLVIAAIFGFIIGSMMQPLYDRSSECSAVGQPIVPCLFNSSI
ncbi:hypothetical protein A244_39058 [Pseudomonas syringae pv. actinidiae ICMP 18807]|uniref:Uncharacterized protein n=1 Tax=Pseudomonas syringae pv. actinidiae ICMP 18807 TaxID=1194404 RepID=S6SGC1_PSESF|nr:hypothetical protein A244_39058 [Pseudomonas syringae pv. actinidiae ICMP 18807]